MLRTSHQLGDFGPVWLVGWTIEQQSYRTDQDLAIPGTQDNPFVPGRRRQRTIPERFALPVAMGA